MFGLIINKEGKKLSHESHNKKQSSPNWRERLQNVCFYWKDIKPITFFIIYIEFMIYNCFSLLIMYNRQKSISWQIIHIYMYNYWYICNIKIICYIKLKLDNTCVCIIFMKGYKCHLKNIAYSFLPFSIHFYYNQTTIKSSHFLLIFLLFSFL